ncbi:hypothetical protein BRADI_5g13944v3 [Brachypodium distachyon]|uniref:50S ribosomal protein L33, chloroplastic n=1 Tax=Brachypodium distachyon TaxID=15368 RepID=A0A0Q3KSV6_BRADI|nr:hypothetical protein BRADI_5g13944v3 [Brachypodium distachyon]
MAKGKDVRIRVILECISCVQKGANEESTGISRYSTEKNRHNTPGQLEFKFFCHFVSNASGSGLLYCRPHVCHSESRGS